jgi:hypothetical protein
MELWRMDIFEIYLFKKTKKKDDEVSLCMFSFSSKGITVTLLYKLFFKRKKSP